MKISMNQVQLLGNVVDDPVFQSEKDLTVATLFVMTNKVGHDETGKRIQHPQVNRVFLYNELNAFVKKNIQKGAYVFIAGELETRYWKDDNGSDHSFTVVVANKISVEQADNVPKKVNKTAAKKKASKAKAKPKPKAKAKAKRK